MSVIYTLTSNSKINIKGDNPTMFMQFSLENAKEIHEVLGKAIEELEAEEVFMEDGNDES